MTVASFQFLTFLGFIFLLWRFVAPGDESRKNLLLLASYAFYCTWDVRFAAILLGTTIIQWLVGARIHQSQSRKARLFWLWTSLTWGLGCLAYFKYAGFFVDGLASLLEGFGLGSIAPMAGVAAPIGISFFTFQSLTYTIDIYRQQETPTRSLRNFALFIAFFPHVTSGPIARSRLLIPQFEAKRDVAGPLEPHAIFLIARGLFKKIAIADVLAAQFVTPAFSDPALWSSPFLFLAVIAYSFQIYMDLSGYTDIARGAARCFGYNLSINFNRPYLAQTVSNFWQRWHMTMSGFFREYLYWSLGGTRRGNVYVNLMLTFIAIGIWHGAGWTFILYGFLHGSVVCLERVRRLSRRRRGLSDSSESISGRTIGLLYTFGFVAFARILFVESDLAGAWEFCSMLVNSPGTGGAAGIQGYVMLTLAIVAHAIPREWSVQVATRAFNQHPIVQGALWSTLAYTLIAVATETRPFVYFQF